MHNTSLDCVEPTIISLKIVIVLFCLSMIAEHFCRFRNVLVIGRDCPCFSAGSKILSGIEAEGGGSAHRTCSSPGIQLSGEVLGSMCLAGIFNDDQTISFGKIENRIHVDHL